MFGSLFNTIHYFKSNNISIEEMNRFGTKSTNLILRCTLIFIVWVWRLIWHFKHHVLCECILYCIQLWNTALCMCLVDEYMKYFITSLQSHKFYLHINLVYVSTERNKNECMFELYDLNNMDKMIFGVWCTERQSNFIRPRTNLHKTFSKKNIVNSCSVFLTSSNEKRILKYSRIQSPVDDYGSWKRITNDYNFR